MKSFLNNFMINKLKLDHVELEKTLEQTRLTFEQTCADVVCQLGEKPFHRRGPLNLGLLDSVMVMMSFARENGITDAQDRYQALLADETFLEDVTRNTSDTLVVRRRFGRAQEIMLGPR
jgi:hypothetical protein